MQYESSIEKTIETRREFINCLKSQIELLNKVKVSLQLCVRECVHTIYVVVRITETVVGWGGDTKFIQY